MDKFTSTYSKMLHQFGKKPVKNDKVISEQASGNTVVSFAATAEWIDIANEVNGRGLVFSKFTVKKGNTTGQEFYIELVVPFEEEDELKSIISDAYGDAESAIEQADVEVTRDGISVPPETFFGI